VTLESVLRTCSFPSCDVRTLGEFCLAHERKPAVPAYPRGRPFRATGGDGRSESAVDLATEATAKDPVGGAPRSRH
jgi:hypothetical protein